MTPFRDQKSEIMPDRGTVQSHGGIEEGPLPTQHTRVSRFDRLRRSTPLPQLFLNNSSSARPTLVLLNVLCVKRGFYRPALTQRMRRTQDACVQRIELIACVHCVA